MDRTKARAKGALTYTGSICGECWGTTRYTSNRICYVCAARRSANRAAMQPDELAALRTRERDRKRAQRAAKSDDML